MTTANDNAPAKRPASFDAHVTAYLPGLNRLARRYTKTAEQRQDLVTDTVMYALEKWQNFRGDPADARSGFFAWLTWQMRGVVKNGAVKAEIRKKHITMVPLDATHVAATPATQDVHVDLSATLRDVSSMMNGDVLMRRAMGDTLQEIAADRGVTRERVRQIEVAARARLVDGQAGRAAA
jgi:RNA polymerase sigma factor (sigma-70 family)